MIDDPSEAGTPRTKGATRAYEGDGIRVTWDASLCIHVATCLRLLPRVFDVQARPWVDVTGAPAEEIAATVRACPTGALGYDGEPWEEVTSVEVRPNGPAFLRGRLSIGGPGREPVEMRRAALCRCGASENKPYCDNSHRLVGFCDAPREDPA